MLFTQGFSSLPRVSEAFTPINTFNTYIQDENKREENKKREKPMGKPPNPHDTFTFPQHNVQGHNTSFTMKAYSIDNSSHLQILSSMLKERKEKETLFETPTLVQARVRIVVVDLS